MAVAIIKLIAICLNFAIGKFGVYVYLFEMQALTGAIYSNQRGWSKLSDHSHNEQ